MYNKFCKVQQVEQVFTLIAWRKVFIEYIALQFEALLAHAKWL